MLVVQRMVMVAEEEQEVLEKTDQLMTVMEFHL
jgi:hypothetical protein